MRGLLRILGWLALAFVVTAVTLAVVYLCSDRPGRVALEQRALDVVDGVREDGTTPARVVGWLDQVADRTEVIKGDIVPAPAPAEAAVIEYQI